MGHDKSMGKVESNTMYKKYLMLMKIVQLVEVDGRAAVGMLMQCL